MRTPHHAYTLCNQIYAKSTKRIFLIPHRTKKHHDAKKMIHDIVLLFHRYIHSENIFKIPNIHGVMISQLQEKIQNLITQAGYIYNQECFIGIDFANNKSNKNRYLIDEYIRDANQNEMFTYMTQYVRFYNPLIILNPLSDEDEDGYKEMERLCGETIIIGKNYKKDMIQTSLTQVPITENITIKEIRDIQNWLTAHPNKVLLHTIQTDATYIEFIVNELQPDFLEMPFHQHTADSN